MSKLVNDGLSPLKFDSNELSGGFLPSRFDEPDLSKLELKMN